ncbi:hypothetical protein ACTXT7_003821 [Hymenolepis weldensis]
MRSAHIIASQGRKLPETFSRVPIRSAESTGSHHKHRHSLIQAAIPPLARFDDSETESDTSGDSTSTYDESHNGYAQDAFIRSNDDYRRVLHQRQLMAIRASLRHVKIKQGGATWLSLLLIQKSNSSDKTEHANYSIDLLALDIADKNLLTENYPGLSFKLIFCDAAYFLATRT